MVLGYKNKLCTLAIGMCFNGTLKELHQENGNLSLSNLRVRLEQNKLQLNAVSNTEYVLYTYKAGDSPTIFALNNVLECQLMCLSMLRNKRFWRPCLMT